MTASTERLAAQFVQLGPDLLSYFRRRIGSSDDAADLFAECLAVAWRRHKDAPSDVDELRVWMFAVARNVLSNWRRGARRRSELVQRLGSELSVDRAERPLPEVREAIDRLPSDQAELVRLVHWDGFKINEAATVLGLSESTARGRYQRARAALSTDPGIRSLSFNQPR